MQEQMVDTAPDQDEHDSARNFGLNRDSMYR